MNIWITIATGTLIALLVTVCGISIVDEPLKAFNTMVLGNAIVYLVRVELDNETTT